MPPLGALLAQVALNSLLLTVFGLVFKNYLSNYASEKGKNLATKEDIASITNEVERIRHEYNSALEQMRAQNQMRTASLDRRLEAHQEAFARWRSLVGNPDEVHKAILECQDWWEKNCLYLEPEVRQAFVEAYVGANSRAQLVSAQAGSTEILAAWTKVRAFPDLLFKAVQLPPLTPVEEKSLTHAASKV